MIDITPLVFFGVAIIVVIVLLRTIRIVPQKQVKIIERLGKYHRSAEAGLNTIVPFLDSVRETIDLREQITKIEPQSVITRDNVTMEVDAVIYFLIADPVRATYEVQNLRWGLEQMTAERTRRAVVTTAEGEKAAAILRAEGAKQSAIVSAEGAKQSAILSAEGQAEARLRVAQAEAQAIQMVAQALGAKESPAQYLIAQKYLESLGSIAANAQKLVFLPYEASGVMASLGGIKELLQAK